MNAVTPTARGTLLTLALALTLSSCKKEEASPVVVPPPTDPVTTPASTDIKPATGAVEASDENIAAAQKSMAEAADAARKQWLGKTFEEFEATVYKEPGEGGKYIVSGDMAIPDRKLLREFFDKLQQEADGVAHGKLTVQLAAAQGANGGVDIWTSAKKRKLTYCVSDAFGAHKPAVIADMEAASKSWEEAAMVDFIHVPAQDASCDANNANVLFDVRPVDVGGEYLARAFFPSDQRRDRNVLIDSTSFDLPAGEQANTNPSSVYGFGHLPYYRHVADVLDGTAEPLLTGREGRKSVEIIEAAYESSRTGSAVAVQGRTRR